MPVRNVEAFETPLTGPETIPNQSASAYPTCAHWVLGRELPVSNKLTAEPNFLSVTGMMVKKAVSSS